MKNSILNKIPKKLFSTEKEKLNFYRLGIFEGKAYELVEFFENHIYPAHVHKHSESYIYCVIGKGIIILNGIKKPYKKGDYFYVRKRMSHGFEVKEQTLFLSINKPPIMNENGEIDFEY